MSSPPFDEILRIADSATEIFASFGYRCCLFGSTACCLFGSTERLPNDLDIIVFDSDVDQEQLKDILVSQDNNFYLRPSTNPNATYQVLWYALPTQPRSRRVRGRKVDILIPGIMNIPYIPSPRIVHIDQLPVMPLMPLLLMKLQGWSDHRDSFRTDFQEKVPVDVHDILELLPIACDKDYCRLSRSAWLPQGFLNAAQRRVEEFVDIESMDSAWQWRILGFDI